ncbi:hypothetical protein IW140_004014 [Coemansia sp. RSA 1813]|nr:hypothetical protein EV178_003949 [Coemansia sp. RSA 1646]KAJ1771127.1 hypothetical protein LPJ74_002620 [Coemansia sp. RSA 1843]KAJ2088483.1 hypothetical protein IW138_004171 [Coemansia sp. RSA 986]KAJ2217076.1 hypothetical protein EV179_000843 [Coemansia sp. RSA 487]KAJ2568286.1 hypothetical protein IW140_004014 [Coemansia sp. RSA 1813]
MAEAENNSGKPLVEREVNMPDNSHGGFLSGSAPAPGSPPQYYAVHDDEHHQGLHRANSDFIAEINQIPVNSDDDEALANPPQHIENDDEHDEELELNRMISTIGFGRYHRRVLALCGLGWLADNMWMQCTACILPRVQQHFSISDARIGLLSSSMFLGLMCGALVWGPVSDRFGRLIAYRWTLVVSGTFGLMASAAPSFGLLCACLFGLGSGVGGNMPVDGAIFLEFIPREKRHLLTMLSVFFSFGSVVTSAAALALLPPFSCPDDLGPEGCDVSKLNNGWRYLLITMGLTTFAMVILRNICFRLHETPKFLLQNKGRSDVVIVLKKIVHYNGGTAKASSPRIADESIRNANSNDNTNAPGDENIGDHSALMAESSSQSGNDSNADRPSWLEWPEDSNTHERASSHGSMASRRQGRASRTIKSRLQSWLQSTRTALDVSAHKKLLKPLFAPSLRRTTILVWTIWATVAMGFTMFNVFLPKLLETHSGNSGSRQNNLQTAAARSHSKQVRVYRDALIYAVSGVPGSIIGSWMVNTRLGRIYSMALSTFVSGLALIAFAFSAKAHSSALTIASSSVFGLMSTLMFAVIYAYTPEVFYPAVRGTACGTASAFGRVAGIIAPLITGLLLSISTTVPLYVSVGLLWAAAGCMIALPIETRDFAT